MAAPEEEAGEPTGRGRRMPVVPLRPYPLYGEEDLFRFKVVRDVPEPKPPPDIENPGQRVLKRELLSTALWNGLDPIYLQENADFMFADYEDLVDAWNRDEFDEMVAARREGMGIPDDVPEFETPADALIEFHRHVQLGQAEESITLAAIDNVKDVNDIVTEFEDLYVELSTFPQVLPGIGSVKSQTEKEMISRFGDRGVEALAILKERVKPRVDKWKRYSATLDAMPSTAEMSYAYWTTADPDFQYLIRLRLEEAMENTTGARDISPASIDKLLERHKPEVEGLPAVPIPEEAEIAVPTPTVPTVAAPKLPTAPKLRKYGSDISQALMTLSKEQQKSLATENRAELSFLLRAIKKEEPLTTADQKQKMDAIIRTIAQKIPAEQLEPVTRQYLGLS